MALCFGVATGGRNHRGDACDDVRQRSGPEDAMALLLAKRGARPVLHGQAKPSAPTRMGVGLMSTGVEERMPIMSCHARMLAETASAAAAGRVRSSSHHNMDIDRMRPRLCRAAAGRAGMARSPARQPTAGGTAQALQHDGHWRESRSAGCDGNRPAGCEAGSGG